MIRNRVIKHIFHVLSPTTQKGFVSTRNLRSENKEARAVNSRHTTGTETRRRALGSFSHPHGCCEGLLCSVRGTVPAWEPACVSNDSGLAHVPLSMSKRRLSDLKGLWAWVPQDTWVATSSSPHQRVWQSVLARGVRVQKHPMGKASRLLLLGAGQ